MDYKAIYIKLVMKRAKEPFSGVSEKHHILPKSIYGEGPKVTLSIREHFLAHRLLAKIYPAGTIEWLKMHRALYMMAHTRNACFISSREFERGRLANRLLSSGDNNPARLQENRDKISEAKMGVPRPDLIGKRFFGADDAQIEEIKRKISEAKIGKPLNYPKDRKSRGSIESINDNISKAYSERNEKHLKASGEEILSMFQGFVIYNPKGRFNSNINRILKLRSESIHKYFYEQDGKWILRKELQV